MFDLWQKISKIFRRKKKQKLWLVLLVILPFLIGLTLYSLTQVKQVTAQWWDETWLYRREIQISNSNSVDLENFQVSFIVDTASLITSGKLQNTCNDLRITDWSGNILPHWIEENNPGCNSASTRVWVKIPSVYKGTNATSIFVYYGNSSASNIENGNNVFEFFDDFNETTLNSDIWATTGSSSVSGGSMTVTTGTVYTKSPILSSASGYIYEARNMWSTTSGNYSGLQIASASSTSGSNSTAKGLVYLMTPSTASLAIQGWAANGTTSSYNIVSGVTQYTATQSVYSVGGFSIDSTNIRFFNNRTQTNSYVGSWSDAPYLWFGYFTGSGAGTISVKDMSTDWVVVRKFALSEPGASLSTTEEVSPAPIAYWKFDEGSGSTAYDSSGQNNNGNLINSLSWMSEENCISGKCLYFNGTNNYIDVGNHNSLNPTQELTLSLWVYNQRDTGKHTFLVKKASGSGGYGIYQDTLERLAFFVYWPSGSPPYQFCYTYGYSLPQNEWTHIVGKFKQDDSLKIYINGIEKNSCSNIYSGPIGTTGGNLSLGILGWWGSDNAYFKGTIDEVKIYPYARTAEQINADYIAGAANIGSKAVFGHKAETAVITPLSEKLVAHWKFDEGSGDTVNDYAGENNHGKIISNANWTNSGKIGKALIFDGIAARIQNIPVAPFEYRGEDFSISLWYKRATSDDNSYLISKPWNGSGQYNYGVILNSNDGLIFSLLGATSWSTQINNFSVREEWTHLGVTIDQNSKEVNIYKNGKIVLTTTHNISDWTPTLGNSSLSLCIGSLYPYQTSWSGNTTYSFEGLIDEVKIYNTALTPEEILQDYNQGMSTVMGQSPVSPAGSAGSAASEYCIPGDTSPCAPPVLEWKFEENQGTTAYDTGSNKHHGTITSGVWTKGIKGSAVNLTGYLYRVTANDDDALSSQNFTLNFWFKWNESNSAWPRVGKMNQNSADAQNEYSFQFLQSDGRWYLRFNNSATAFQQGNGQILDTTLNKWHFISITYNKTTNALRIVQNGSRILLNTTSDITINNSEYNFIAYNQNSYSLDYDNIQYFNYARTPAQIAWDYNRGAPVGHWRFDECQGTTVHDVTGNGNNGTINIGATGTQTAAGTCTSGVATDAWYNGRDGKFNSSLSFDGVDDYVELPASVKLPEKHTISAWINIPSFTNVDIQLPIFGEYPSGTSDTKNYLYVAEADRLVRYDQWPPSAGSALSTTAISTNTWYHIAAVQTSSNFRIIYVNGKEEGTATEIYTGSETNLFAIGRRLGTTNYNFNGQIDDVRIYNYALTPDQIKLLYNDNAAVRF